MHDRIYCYDFHGVRFRDIPGLKLSAAELPNADFYAAIYGRIAPDERFIEAKRHTGKMIASLLAERRLPGRLLSWGAGTGLVESELVKAGWQVDAVEPGSSEHWPDARKFNHLSEVPPGPYDVVLTVSALYSQSDADTKELLRQFASRVRPGGLCLIAEQDTRSVLGALRGLLVRRLHSPRRGAQFWGHLRGPGFYLSHTPLKHVWSRYYTLDEQWAYHAIQPPVRLFDRQLVTRHSRMQFHLFQNAGAVRP